ncbi:MAG: DNA polymerase II [Thiotrichales bacterium]|nr:DNA polymerase II [Thiotrichales bacterium]
MTPAATLCNGSLLTRQWRDQRDGLELVYWAASDKGPVRIVVSGERAVFFLNRDTTIELEQLKRLRATRTELELGCLANNDPVDGLYFKQQRDLIEARQTLRLNGARIYESDLKPSDRYLMERFITSGLKLKGTPIMRDGFVEYRNPSLKRDDYRAALEIVSVDIETDGLYGALFSIAVSGRDVERVFMLGEPVPLRCGFEVEFCADERVLLETFFTWIRSRDPDVLIGWNVIAFDLDYLERRARKLGVEFALGRGGDRATILRPDSPTGTHVARIPGRLVLDGIDALRAAFWSFESFELETVAQAMLGRGKRIDHSTDKVAEIGRLFRDDKTALAVYNLEDCRLVLDIFAHAKLIEFAQRRAELTGLAADRFGGSVAAFDNLYLPRLHRKGRVAPDTHDVGQGPGSPGGYVLDSTPGLYDNVLLLDFKSLYPSIIRTFNIDPFAMFSAGEDAVPGFLEASFAREGAILPELISELWAARDQAKRLNDAPLSQAVKILMNSFYGVMAAEGCRFYDARLASSITRRGHEIIQSSRDLIEERGFQVIYGDTDSLFVLLGSEYDQDSSMRQGEHLAQCLNDWWTERLMRELHLESHLEVEFETHFARFLMPTVRGDRTGSKKRYAGLVRHADGTPELVFKGLESVRTDWTPLARGFQRELYRRVFLNEPFEAYVRETLERLLAGELDDQLVYRKRLRRPVDEYKRNIPPHVQAAKKLDKPSRWVNYVITSSGPEPVTEVMPKPDYEHYRERQLAPAADGLLYFLDSSFGGLTDQQLEFF